MKMNAHYCVGDLDDVCLKISLDTKAAQWVNAHSYNYQMINAIVI